MGKVTIIVEHPLDSVKLKDLVDQSLKLESSLMKSTGTAPKVMIIADTLSNQLSPDTLHRLAEDMGQWKAGLEGDDPADLNAFVSFLLDVNDTQQMELEDLKKLTPIEQILKHAQHIEVDPNLRIILDDGQELHTLLAISHDINNVMGVAALKNVSIVREGPNERQEAG